MTFAAPIKVDRPARHLRRGRETAARTIRDVKEEEVFFGEIPLMSDGPPSSFNGTERVIVSQLHRSRACSSSTTRGAPRLGESALFRPDSYRTEGFWLDFEFDHKDQLFIRSTGSGSSPSPFCCGFGRSTEDLLRTFYDVEEVDIDGTSCSKEFRPELMVG